MEYEANFNVLYEVLQKHAGPSPGPMIIAAGVKAADGLCEYSYRPRSETEHPICNRYM